MLYPLHLIYITHALFAAGGWWAAERFAEISGPIAIEISDMCYVTSQDNGQMIRGPSRPIGKT